MTVWPLRFRTAPDGLVFTDDAGGWFKSDEPFLDRYATGNLNGEDHRFLRAGGHEFGQAGDLAHTAFAWRWATRLAATRPLSYVIVVPTLRCNLSCGYCQVSRAGEQARGYDWSEDIADHVLRFLDQVRVDEIKVEFQGGEPLLRLDLLDRVRAFCQKRFKQSTFVVCTNLQRLGDEEWAFLNDADTFISTSLDGDPLTHRRQRTQTDGATSEFYRNLVEAIDRFGPDKLSALPTIDIENPPDLAGLADIYEEFGLRSIYLRPINHHGFARRRYVQQNGIAAWNQLHSNFIDMLVERNYRTGRSMEEYYFSQCLRRVLGGRTDNHVDLRNPNLAASDYLVIDYDGRLYPSDEARMLARIGHVDLSVGDVVNGLDRQAVATLNSMALNNFDPDCIHCAYQPFCGTDAIDDVSRYGRVDRPRHDTWFCGRHMAIFDKVFELIYRDDEAARASLAAWAGVAAWPAVLSPVHS